MTNPQMPHIPGAAVMTDTLDFVKSLWGSMGVPGIGIPGIAALLLLGALALPLHLSPLLAAGATVVVLLCVAVWESCVLR